MGEIFRPLESKTTWTLRSLKLQFSVSITFLTASQDLFDWLLSGLSQPKLKIHWEIFFVKGDAARVSIFFAPNFWGKGGLDTVQKLSLVWDGKWQFSSLRCLFSCCSLANYGIQRFFVCFVNIWQKERERFKEQVSLDWKRLVFCMYFTYSDFAEDLKFQPHNLLRDMTIFQTYKNVWRQITQHSCATLENERPSLLPYMSPKHCDKLVKGECSFHYLSKCLLLWVRCLCSGPLWCLQRASFHTAKLYLRVVSASLCHILRKYFIWLNPKKCCLMGSPVTIHLVSHFRIPETEESLSFTAKVP